MFKRFVIFSFKKFCILIHVRSVKCSIVVLIKVNWLRKECKLRLGVYKFYWFKENCLKIDIAATFNYFILKNNVLN